MIHFGIDFGSKMAGTTAIAYNPDDKIYIMQSPQKKDADKFIQNVIYKQNPERIFIDAPLSLPLIYSEPNKGEDFFYRHCDKLVKAMSPMFLGGLTARAMELAAGWRKNNISVFESYPKKVKQILLPGDDLYKKSKENIAYFMKALNPFLKPYKVECLPQNWHQVDAVLCWTIGLRYAKTNVKSYGDEQEGIIYA